ISIGNLRTGTTLLRHDSFHPRPLIKRLPVNQFSCIRRICSSDASYQKQTKDLTQRFKERGYKDNWAKRFEGLTQLESLQPKVKEKAEHVPSCFTQYSPLGKAFKDIIRKHWYIIATDPQLKPIFKYPLCTVWSLKDPQMGGDIERKLFQRESFRIHRLNTLSPLGLN
ncbi:unnamed protein product, partial [Coregonus sp. 'balchen']